MGQISGGGLFALELAVNIDGIVLESAFRLTVRQEELRMWGAAGSGHTMIYIHTVTQHGLGVFCRQHGSGFLFWNSGPASERVLQKKDVVFEMEHGANR